MRFDNQIKCNGAQELIEETNALLTTEKYDSEKVNWLINRIWAQVFILRHCTSYSPPEDQIDMWKAIADLRKQDELLQGLVAKNNKKKSKK